MAFDLQTVLISYSITLAMSLAFGWASAISHKNLPGAKEWIAGFSFLLPGLILFSLRNVASDFLSIVVANVCILSAGILCIAGLLRWSGRQGFSRLQFKLAIIAVCVYGAFFYLTSIIYDVFFLRLVISLVVQICLGCISAYIVYKKKLKGLGRPLFVLGYLLSAVAGLVFFVHVVLYSHGHVAFGNNATSMYLGFVLIFFTMIVFGFVAMLSDEVRAELELRHLWAMENIRQRQELEAMIHHDLKSPLVPILQWARTLEQSDRLPRGAVEVAGKISGSAQRMNDIIEQNLLLYQAKRQGLELVHAQTDVSEILHQLAAELQVLCQEKDVRLQVDAPERLTMDACSATLGRALDNLIRNAIEASPRFAQVSVAVETIAHNVHITITNEGEMDVETQSALFHGFVKTHKSHGHGMGAYAAALYIAAHRGDVWLDTSTPGLTTVVVRLPRRARAHRPAM